VSEGIQSASEKEMKSIKKLERCGKTKGRAREKGRFVQQFKGRTG